VLLLVAGVQHLRAQQPRDSLDALGPALGMATLPTAFLALAQAGGGADPLRAALIILGGAALAVVGAWLRVRVALLVGLAAATLAALGQLLALVSLLPRWLSLAVAGTLLLTAGFTAERLDRARRRAWQATRRMR
jgi:hypothetical protein